MHNFNLYNLLLFVFRRLLTVLCACHRWLRSARPLPAPVPKRVVVYVLDSGVDLSHPVLKEYGGSVSLVWSGFSNLSDEEGHGTMVVGVVAKRVLQANIKVLKVLCDNDMDRRIFKNNVVAALRYIQVTLDKEAINMVNISLSIFSKTAICLINELAELGCVTYVAAGNQSTLMNTTFGFDIARKFFIVGSLDLSENNIAWFSNRGAAVDAYAVGENIPTIAPGGQETLERGTSFSAPLVLAYVACLCRNEKLTWETVKAILDQKATEKKFLFIKDF